MHPLDHKGKTPLNLERGVFSNVGTKGASSQIIPVERGQKWETLKTAPREALSGSLASAPPPARVSRTVVEANSGVRAVSPGKDSSIVYDPREHRFVNTNSPAPSSSAASSNMKSNGIRAENGRTAASTLPPATVAPPRTPATAPPVRSANSAPPPRSITPPPAPRYSGGDRGGSPSASGRGSGWGGSSSSSSAGASSSGRSSSSPTPSSSAPASHPSSGRPH